MPVNMALIQYILHVPPATMLAFLNFLDSKTPKNMPDPPALPTYPHILRYLWIYLMIS